MKYIITESQYGMLQMRQWVSRRYNLVSGLYSEAVEEIDPCNYDDCESYVINVIYYIMNELHPYYYLIDDFDYESLSNTILNLYQNKLTKICHKKRKNCQ
jgi:hypothetical protein